MVVSDGECARWYPLEADSGVFGFARDEELRVLSCNGPHCFSTRLKPNLLKASPEKSSSQPSLDLPTFVDENAPELGVLKVGFEGFSRLVVCLLCPLVGRAMIYAILLLDVMDVLLPVDQRV